MSNESQSDSTTPRKHITFGVTIERHSKGTNYSIRIDNAESEEEVMERVKVLWDKLEYKFGAQGGAQ